MLKGGIVSAAGCSWASPPLLVHLLNIQGESLYGLWEVKQCHSVRTVSAV